MTDWSSADGRAGLAGAVALAVLCGGCGGGGPEEPPEIETVEVAPAVDSELTTEGDLQAVRGAAEIAGVLPESVPPDLPLFVPSSVVDFGQLADGRAYVELDTGARPAAVRGWLEERLPAAGWAATVAGADTLEGAKGGRRVTFRLSDQAPGTRIRLVYRP